jgi:hypothetical protein
MGNAIVEASNEAPQVIVLAAVPVIAIHNICPFVGVPDKLVVIDVMFPARAVIE